MSCLFVCLFLSLISDLTHLHLIFIIYNIIINSIYLLAVPMKTLRLKRLSDLGRDIRLLQIQTTRSVVWLILITYSQHHRVYSQTEFSWQKYKKISTHIHFLKLFLSNMNFVVIIIYFKRVQYFGALQYVDFRALY